MPAASPSTATSSTALVRWTGRALTVGLIIIGGGLITLALGGCALAMPYRQVASPPTANDGDPAPMAHVSITHADYDPAESSTFWDFNRAIIRLLPNQEGLLGYSLRRRILGSEVWTMTVWRDRQAMLRFMYSREHLAAMREGLPTIEAFRNLSYSLSADALPPTWDDALARLDAAGPLRPNPERRRPSTERETTPPSPPQPINTSMPIPEPLNP